MKKLKLIELLRTLDKKELKRFEKYLVSPFFNNGRNYLPLLKEIIVFYPEFDSEKMTTQYIYSRLYPGKTFSEKTMKNMASGLLKMAEGYLMEISMHERGINNNILLAEELQNRKLFSLSVKAYENSMKLLTKNGVDPYHFDNCNKYWSTMASHYQLTGEVGKNTEVLSKEYMNFIYYVISMFSLITQRTYVYKYNLNAEFDWSLINKFAGSFEAVIRHLKENNYELNGIIELYYNIIKMSLNDFDEKIYYEIKRGFKDNFEKFSRGQKFRMYATLHNSIVRLQTIDYEAFLQENFALFKDMAQLELLNFSQGSVLNIDLVTSIVKAALNAGEYDWLRKFMKDHIEKIPVKFRESVYNYAYANLCFEKKDFHEAQEYLKKVGPENIGFKYDIKELLLKIYYELKYLEEARSLIDSFRHFVSENKSVSEEKKISNGNFIKFYSELLKCEAVEDMLQTEQLRSKLLNTNQVRSKNWLLKKIDELKSRN